VGGWRKSGRSTAELGRGTLEPELHSQDDPQHRDLECYVRKDRLQVWEA